MPRPKKLELEFPVGIYPLANELKIPYTRLYNHTAALGVANVEAGEKRARKISLESEETLQTVIIMLMNKNVSPEALVKVFGSEMTLGRLASLAEEIAPLPEPKKRNRVA